MAFDIDRFADYYADRLPVQYRTQPKARGTIRILAALAAANGLAQQLQAAFDVDNAVGPQLDIIGKYVGLSRNINDVLDRAYFGFVLYAGGGNTNGFRRYGGGYNLSGIFYSYAFSGQTDTALTDSQYQFAIKLKIILNQSDNTLASIMAYLNLFFKGVVSLTDNRDMTFSYVVAEAAPLSLGLLQAFLPKPMGVGINVIKVSDRVTADSTLRVTADGSTRFISI